MIDDDTYLFKENLRLLLQKYDPSVPHYLGSQTIFVGCDNVIEWYEGPLFAHGGSGIVISQAAMKILFKRMDTCILKYRHCWAGDIRTGLCLRDGGILLEDPKGFNKEPPNEHFTFGDDPCFKPLTFHHLLVKQMQSLAQLERNKEAQGLKPVITMADVFNDTRRGLPDVSANMDRPNYDFEAYIDPSPKNCHAMCEENPKCRSYVHDGENCWLKSAVPGNTVATGHVSGIIPSHYTCTKLL